MDKNKKTKLITELVKDGYNIVSKDENVTILKKGVITIKL